MTFCMQSPRSAALIQRDDSSEGEEFGVEAVCFRVFDSNQEHPSPEVFSSTSSDDEAVKPQDPEASRMGFVPLLQKAVKLDDQEATYILVFPRATSAKNGGAVDPNEQIEGARIKAMKIFWRHQNSNSSTTLHKLQEDKQFPLEDSTPVVAKLYQEKMRDMIVTILHNSGFKCATMESIDKDEVFLKVWMPNDGWVIQALAERYQYRVPYKAEVYGENKIGFKQGRPKTNYEGKPVLAYQEFKRTLEDKLHKFRDVDAIRILEKRLDRWMNLPEMVNQNIITRCFPAAKYADVMHLHEKWASLQHLPTLPKKRKMKK